MNWKGNAAGDETAITTISLSLSFCSLSFCFSRCLSRSVSVALAVLWVESLARYYYLNDVTHTHIQLHLCVACYFLYFKSLYDYFISLSLSLSLSYSALFLCPPAFLLKNIYTYIYLAFIQTHTHVHAIFIFLLSIGGFELLTSLVHLKFMYSQKD